MRVKVDEWPVVLSNDDGLRSIGEQGRCFYCKAAVGQPHGRECVTVCKLVKYDVLSDGIEVGTFETDDPCHWTAHDCNFHKNESSWCADNALDSIQWLDSAFAEKVEQFCMELSEEDCACATLEFRFAEVIDEGPFIQLRE